MDPPKKNDNPNPKAGANPISKLLFLWVEMIFIKKKRNFKIWCLISRIFLFQVMGFCYMLSSG
jgi:hypothetical protein